MDTKIFFCQHHFYLKALSCYCQVLFSTFFAFYLERIENNATAIYFHMSCWLNNTCSSKKMYQDIKKCNVGLVLWKEMKQNGLKFSFFFLSKKTSWNWSSFCCIFLDDLLFAKLTVVSQICPSINFERRNEKWAKNHCFFFYLENFWGRSCSNNNNIKQLLVSIHSLQG